jgi:hypothetical protein
MKTVWGDVFDDISPEFRKLFIIPVIAMRIRVPFNENVRFRIHGSKPDDTAEGFKGPIRQLIRIVLEMQNHLSVQVLDGRCRLSGSRFKILAQIIKSL